MALPLVTGCHSGMQFLVGEDPRDHEEYLRKRFKKAGDFLKMVETSAESAMSEEAEMKMHCFHMYDGNAWFSFMVPLMRVWKCYEFYYKVERLPEKTRVKIVKLELCFEGDSL
jgi:hypothetical protein